MTIHISGRGVTVGVAVRRRVEAKVAKFSRVLPKVTETRVVLGLERHRHLAEVTLQAKGTTLRAGAAAGDFQAAVDGALENLERQVRRRKERITARNPRPSRQRAAVQYPAPPEPPTPPTPEEPVLSVRRISAKPMSIDEALEQMRLREGLALLLFTNAQSRVVNALRRRSDGGLELVEPGG